MNNTSLHLKSQYGTSLNTREAAIHLCKAISRLASPTVELDCKGVEFMSRSFADQFHKERQVLRNEYNISVFLINTNEEIDKILDIVSRTQNKKERSYNDILVSRFSDIKDVTRFLHSL